MELNERYEDGFLSQVDASQRGEVVKIPVGYERVGKVFNLLQSRYILLAGSTGSGKTSLADEMTVLQPWTLLKSGQLPDVHWETLYFSLERKQMFKHAKWVSWMIYRDFGYQISADQIMGWGDAPLSEEGYKLVRSYDDEMSELLDHIQLYDGKIKASVVERAIRRRALDLGTFYYSDDEGVYKDDNPVYIVRFEDDGKTKKTKTGNRTYVELEHKGVKFKLYEDDHRYFLNNPKTFVFIVIDGINLLGSKEEIDAISVLVSDARDKYGFSPVIISQQNRSMGDIQRLKHHGGDLSPQLEDIFKSSQMGFDADLVLALFDALKYKAFDTEGKFDGYIIKQGSDGITGSLQTPDGHSRFRSIHVLKNSFGPDGAKFGMKFIGECGYFETLPKPDDEGAMQLVYTAVRKGE